MADSETLTQDELFSLKALGFLYLRLGSFERARRLFRALAALRPEDAESAMSLAAAELEAGHPEEALRRLDIPPLERLRDTPLCCLLRAQTYWRLQRDEEAFAAMDAFLDGREA
jgi:tetratricopeptide (TPR) repeat protein